MSRTNLSRVQDLLIAGRYVTEAQIDAAHQSWVQAGRHGVFEDFLVEHGLVPDQDMAVLLGRKFGIDVVELGRTPEDPAAMALVGLTLATRLVALPLSVSDGELIVALSDPLDFAAPKALASQTKLRVRVVLAPRREIKAALARLAEPGTGTPEAAAQAPSEAPSRGGERGVSGAALLRELLFEARARHARSIFLDPIDRGVGVRMSVGKQLGALQVLPQDQAQSLLTEVRLRAGLSPTPSELPREGRILSGEEEGAPHVVVSCLPTLRGERLRLSLSWREVLPPSLETLPMCRSHVRAVDGLLRSPGGGVLLVAGPPGDNLRPLLVALALRVDPQRHSVVMIEEGHPTLVEHLVQVPVVAAEGGAAWQRALAGASAQDAHVVVLPDLRDGEVARRAFDIAMSGVWVIVGLHSAAPVQAIERLMHLGVEPYNLAWGLRGVVYQRMVRRICGACRDTVRPTLEEIRALGLETFEGQFALAQGRGCAACDHTGVRGELGAQAVATVGPEDRRHFLKAEQSWGLLMRLQDALVTDASAKAIGGYTLGAEVVRLSGLA